MTRTIHLRPRRIIALHSSRAVTLPTEWLHHHQLEPGDELQITLQHDGALVLLPKEADP